MVRWTRDKFSSLDVVLEKKVLSRLSEQASQLASNCDYMRHNDELDLIVTVGGDGTLLHVSSLFKNVKTPPVLSLAAGSLGFLVPFQLHDYPNLLKQLLEQNEAFVFDRMRMQCSLFDHDGVKTYTSMNEIVFQRDSTGSHQNMATMDLWSGDEEFLTSTLADGLMLATPSGSTAYNLAAGGAIVHPTLHAMLLTPICPHSLSFRPVILPPEQKLRIQLNEESRCKQINVSVDGKLVGRLSLSSKPLPELANSVMVSASPYALQSIAYMDGQPRPNWIREMASILRWNQPFKRNKLV